jgi:hypothetical protein
MATASRLLLQKNPDVSFAMEESYPLPSTYVNAAPLGPILEIRASDPQMLLTPERVAQALDYWRSRAEQLSADPELSENSEARVAWAKMATAQANLFANRNLEAEAEQAYRLAAGVSPALLDPVSPLAELLVPAGRSTEASALLDSFAARNPSQKSRVDEERAFLTTLKRP